MKWMFFLVSVYATYALGNVHECEIERRYSHGACGFYEKDHCKIGPQCVYHMPRPSGNSSWIIVSKDQIEVARYKRDPTLTYIQMNIKNATYSDQGLYLARGENGDPTDPVTCSILTIYGNTSTPFVEGPLEPIWGVTYNVTCVVQEISQKISHLAVWYKGKKVRTCNPVQCRPSDADKHTFIAIRTCKIHLDYQDDIFCEVKTKYEWKYPLRGSYHVKFKIETTLMTHTATESIKTTELFKTKKLDITFPSYSDNVTVIDLLNVLLHGLGLVLIICFLLYYVLRKYRKRSRKTDSSDSANPEKKQLTHHDSNEPYNH